MVSTSRPVATSGSTPTTAAAVRVSLCARMATASLGLALLLARDDALVFGDPEGKHRHPERFSRGFKDQLGRCEHYLTKQGAETLPEIRLHDLRHIHATLLLAKGTPVKVVSERLDHASATVTLTVYMHVMPGNQKDAADSFAALVAEA